MLFCAVELAGEYEGKNQCDEFIRCRLVPFKGQKIQRNGHFLNPYDQIVTTSILVLFMVLLFACSALSWQPKKRNKSYYARFSKQRVKINLLQ